MSISGGGPKHHIQPERVIWGELHQLEQGIHLEGSHVTVGAHIFFLKNARSALRWNHAPAYASWGHQETPTSSGPA